MATSTGVPRRGIILESIRVIGPLLILAAGIGFLVISGKLREIPEKPPTPAGLPRVQTAPVSSYHGGISIDVDGLVVPYREIILTSEVAGSIKMKDPDCRAGRFVRAGSLLLEVDPVDYQLELRRLKQELRQAEINVHEIDVQLENLKELAQLAEQEQGLQLREVLRLRSLVGDRIVAQSDLERAQSTEILSRNAVQQLMNQARVFVARRQSTQAGMDLVKTRIEQAEINLARTKIEAPVDGVIVRDLVEEGAFVQRGTALAEFEDTSAVEVRCNLMSDEVAWLTRGHPSGGGYSLPNVPVQIIVKRGAKRFVWDGVLSRFDGVGLDENTRMFPCRILVEEPTGGRLMTTASVIDEEAQESAPTLVRGMYVRVVISVPSDKQLADIPRKALQLGNVVWRVRDGKLSILTANVTQRLKDSVVIELPDDRRLAVGDRVVVSPMTTVVEGMQVDEVNRDHLAADALAGNEVTAGGLQATSIDRPSADDDSTEETAGASSKKDPIIEKTDEAAANPSESDIDSGVST